MGFTNGKVKDSSVITPKIFQYWMSKEETELTKKLTTLSWGTAEYDSVRKRLYYIKNSAELRKRSMLRSRKVRAAKNADREIQNARELEDKQIREACNPATFLNLFRRYMKLKDSAVLSKDSAVPNCDLPDSKDSAVLSKDSAAPNCDLPDSKDSAVLSKDSAVPVIPPEAFIRACERYEKAKARSVMLNGKMREAELAYDSKVKELEEANRKLAAQLETQSDSDKKEILYLNCELKSLRDYNDRLTRQKASVKSESVDPELTRLKKENAKMKSYIAKLESELDERRIYSKVID